jgi:hypothetical protein
MEEYVDCPECLCRAKRMPVLSHINRTDNFYQCESCGQVSCMPKDASTPPMRFNIAPMRAQAITST